MSRDGSDPPVHGGRHERDLLHRHLEAGELHDAVPVARQQHDPPTGPAPAHGVGHGGVGAGRFDDDVVAVGGLTGAQPGGGLALAVVAGHEVDVGAGGLGRDERGLADRAATDHGHPLAALDGTTAHAVHGDGEGLDQAAVGGVDAGRERGRARRPAPGTRRPCRRRGPHRARSRGRARTADSRPRGRRRTPSTGPAAPRRPPDRRGGCRPARGRTWPGRPMGRRWRSDPQIPADATVTTTPSPLGRGTSTTLA